MSTDDVGQMFPTGDPDVQIGLTIHDSRPVILLQSGGAGRTALPLAPADAVEIGLSLVLAAIATQPTEARQALAAATEQLAAFFAFAQQRPPDEQAH